MIIITIQTIMIHTLFLRGHSFNRFIFMRTSNNSPAMCKETDKHTYSNVQRN